MSASKLYPFPRLEPVNVVDKNGCINNFTDSINKIKEEKPTSGMKNINQKRDMSVEKYFLLHQKN